MDRFSHDDVEFLKQSGLFEWKELLTSRIRSHLSSLHTVLVSRIGAGDLVVPEEMDFTRWQLVRGERFENRPYAYLDYPQLFSRSTKFTFRSMFWWGEGVFYALILEGNLLPRYVANLGGRYREMANRGLSLSVATTPWIWHGDGPTVLPLREDNQEIVMSVVKNRNWLKVQRTMSLENLTETDAVVRGGLSAFEAMRPLIARIDS